VNPKKHPNAAAGGLTAWLSGIALYECTKHGVPLDSMEVSSIVGAAVAIVLFFGKRAGLK
jgi:hypothetical protein